MKILVTGKDGQVGARVAHALSSVGRVQALGRANMDLTDPDAVRRTVRELHPEVIVNAAAYTAVDRAESEGRIAECVNATAPGILAEEAKRIGSLLVHYSTGYVFDGTKRGAYDEADTTNPINEYGRSKLSGERAITAVGGDFLILRTNWVYDLRGRNFLQTVLALATERDVLHVVDDQVGSPTWAYAIAEVTADILRDCRHARDASGIYNFTAAGSASRHAFAERALALANNLGMATATPRLVRIRASDFPQPAARPLNSVLAGRKLHSIFGLRLPPWEDQLRDCLAALANTLSRTNPT